ncbi:MAG TPA: exodeoxyribonuclease III [Nannocystis sp.]
MLTIASWNINGFRAALRKDALRPWLAGGPTIAGLQEIRAGAEPLDPVLPPEYPFKHVFPARRPGYSGVALLSKFAPDEVDTRLGPRFDPEGRLQLARFGRLVVANVYFPNGSGSERSNDRVPYKLAFYRALYKKLAALRKEGLRVLVMGDFNTAHREIDLARPKDNKNTSGFLPEERAELDRWLRGGYHDTFRRFEPGPGHYSWWCQRGNCRARNIGWRIDYILACEAALPFVRSAAIHPHVMGSDHCPVSVTVDPEIVR